MKCKNCLKDINRKKQKGYKYSVINGKYEIYCNQECFDKQFIPSEKITTNYDKDNVKYLEEKGCGKEYCLKCERYIELENIGYPISGEEYVCEFCGEHDISLNDVYEEEKGYFECNKEKLCPSCSSNHTPLVKEMDRSRSPEGKLARDEEPEEKYPIMPYKLGDDTSGSDFILSEKRKELIKLVQKEYNNLHEDKIRVMEVLLEFVEQQDKEFIRLLKEEFSYGTSLKNTFKTEDLFYWIDKLSGELK